MQFNESFVMKLNQQGVNISNPAFGYSCTLLQTRCKGNTPASSWPPSFKIVAACSRNEKIGGKTCPTGIKTGNRSGMLRIQDRSHRGSLITELKPEECSIPERSTTERHGVGIMRADLPQNFVFPAVLLGSGSILSDTSKVRCRMRPIKADGPDWRSADSRSKE